METLLRVQFWNKALGRRCFVSPQPFGSYKQLPEKKYSKAGQQPCTLHTPASNLESRGQGDGHLHTPTCP